MARKYATSKPRREPLQVGQRFGRLVTLREGDRLAKRGGKHPVLHWWCLCECGVEKQCAVSALRHGHATSCGCRRAEATKQRRTKHGATANYDELPEYKAWCHAKARCYCPTDAKYRIYGARGITMCDRWRNDFAAFYADMGPKPTPKHSIDRIDVNGNYEPGNCRWATAKEQAQNTRYTITARARISAGA